MFSRGIEVKHWLKMVKRLILKATFGDDTKIKIRNISTRIFVELLSYLFLRFSNVLMKNLTQLITCKIRGD